MAQQRHEIKYKIAFNEQISVLRQEKEWIPCRLRTCEHAVAVEEHGAAALVLVQQAGVLEVRHHRVLALDARVRDAAHLRTDRTQKVQIAHCECVLGT